MNCRLCNKPLYMQYDYNNFGKLIGKWTCQCGHGFPHNDKLCTEEEESIEDFLHHVKVLEKQLKKQDYVKKRILKI